MSQETHFSSQEMLEELFRHEIKGMFDAKSSEKINMEIDKQAEEFDVVKRRKAAKSIEDLGKTYITH